MPTIIRKGFRRAGLLAIFCIVAALCEPPIARAETQDTQSQAAPAVKKKIALTQFDVANTHHVDDISNIYDGLPLALSNRLEASGEFLTTYTGRSIPVGAGEAQRNAIIQIAEQSGAQLLVAGIVINAGIKHEKGFLGTSLGENIKRHIEVELAVYDGLTGSQLLLRRLDEQAPEEVKVGNDKPFGSSLFFETEMGQALSRLLDLAVSDIRAELDKVPFSAHILRVKEKTVFLDAGSDSLLRPGDNLVAYARDATPIAALDGSALGVMDHAVDTITLTHVQPQFSIGELTEDAAKLGIKAGSLAKIDPDEHRILVAKQIAAQQMAKAEQDARDKAERLKAEQAAQAEAARIKAQQDAKAEAARIKAEKKAQAQAKAKAAADAKAAKLKAAKAARVSAAQQAKARALAQSKARAAAEAKAARLKAQEEAKAKTACITAEEMARVEAACVTAEKKVQAETNTAETKTKLTGETPAPQAAESAVAQTGTEVAAEAEIAPVKPKIGTPLKLKPIKP